MKCRTKHEREETMDTVRSPEKIPECNNLVKAEDEDRHHNVSFVLYLDPWSEFPSFLRKVGTKVNSLPPFELISTLVPLTSPSLYLLAAQENIPRKAHSPKGSTQLYNTQRVNAMSYVTHPNDHFSSHNPHRRFPVPPPSSTPRSPSCKPRLTYHISSS